MGRNTHTVKARTFAPNALIISVSILFVLVAMLVPLPGRSLFWSSLQNAGHSLLFMVLTVGFTIVYPGLKQRWSPHHLLKVALAMLVFGFCTEVLQALTGRSVSLKDLLLDTVGIVAGLLLFVAVSKGSSLTGLVRLALSSVAVGALVMCFSIPAMHAVAWWTRPNTPTLAGFDHLFAHLYIESSTNSVVKIVDKPEAWWDGTGRVLQVQLMPGIYTGVRLLEPEPDWRAYERLTFLAYLDGIHEQEFILKIQDRAHDNEYEDRFNRTLLLAPGPNYIAIELDDIRLLGDSYSGHREMDMQFIEALTFFKNRNDSEVTVFLDQFQLE